MGDGQEREHIQLASRSQGMADALGSDGADTRTMAS